MVLHVSQFPSDQECSRYISTMSDLDAVTKCNNCLEFILQAKEKQAEEANRAAESLLEMLAQEVKFFILLKVYYILFCRKRLLNQKSELNKDKKKRKKRKKMLKNNCNFLMFAWECLFF